MASNTSFKILIACEAYERFAAIIRPQELAERGASQSESESDIERGFRKSDEPGQSHLWEKAAKSRKIINSEE